MTKKDENVKAETGKTVKDLTTLELKGIHFDNQGKINFLKQQNQVIIEEIQMRASKGIEADNGTITK